MPREVDRAHVDPELQGASGDHCRQPARLEVVFDQRSLLTRDRPVMSARYLSTGQLVETRTEAFG
jgi:hypothetical protein